MDYQVALELAEMHGIEAVYYGYCVECTMDGYDMFSEDYADHDSKEAAMAAAILRSVKFHGLI